MNMNKEDSNMLSEEYIEEIFLNNEVPDDIGCMLYRDNMNLTTPGDVFLWFKSLPFRNQKIMISNMINVMGDEKINHRVKTPYRAFGDFHVKKDDDLFESLGDLSVSRCETNHTPFKNNDIIHNKEGTLPRLGALSPPPVLKRETSSDYNYDGIGNFGSSTTTLLHPNITVRKKNT